MGGKEQNQPQFPGAVLEKAREMIRRFKKPRPVIVRPEKQRWIEPIENILPVRQHHWPDHDVLF